MINLSKIMTSQEIWSVLLSLALSAAVAFATPPRVEGKAPQSLRDLPAPDGVFIGGTKGAMADIVDAVLSKNPAARICISAIALETLSAAVSALTARGLEAQAGQIAVSRPRAAGSLPRLMGGNPPVLITGNCHD